MTEPADHPLAALLRLAPDATPLELAELLWLGALLPAPAPSPPTDEHVEPPPPPQPLPETPETPRSDDAPTTEALLDATAGAPPDGAASPQGHRRQGRISRPAADTPRLLWHRCLHHLAPQRPTGRPTLDVHATVQLFARTGELMLQTRRELEPAAALFVLDDRAASSAPWLEEIDTLTALATASGRWTRVERHALRSSERVPLGEDPTAAHLPAVQTAEALTAHLRAQPRGTDDVTLVLSDGVAAGWRDGTVARVLDAAPGRRLWAHLWAEERLRQPGLGRLARTHPDAGVVLVPFTPAGLMSARGWLHGRGGDLDAVCLPAPSAGPPAAAPMPSWSDLARRVEVGVPIEVRQILALAAGVPGDFDLDLLRALGERIATRPILPVHFSQALTSGLVERVLDAPGLVIRFRGDDDGDAGARAIALRWLDPPRAEALLQALTDHLDDGAADALGIPYALLLSLRGKEVVDGVAPRTAPGAATALRGLVRLTRRRVERVERWLERVGAPRVATPQSSAGPPPPVEPPQASDQDASTAPVEPDSPDIDDDTKASELLAGEVSTPPTSGGESEATEELERTDAANDPDGVESAEHVQTIDVSVTVDLPWIPEFDDEPEEDSAAAPPPVTKPHLIFVSYARNDKELVDELLDHLRPLAAERGVEVWAGDEIEGGDRWQTQIQAKLDQACLMVACVTPRFLHSMWCREESRYAREAGTVILPVHVSRFSARNDLFADLQFVPDLSRAVAEWGERPWQRDTAWSMVVDAVHVLLDRVDAERAEAAEANAQAVGAERERAAKARAVGAEREQAATAAARAEAEARERPPADAKSSSWATPAGPWDGPNPHLVPPLLTIVPGTHFQGQPGTFLMGSPKGVGYGDERPQRLITLTRTYALGEAPVTQAQWRAVVEAAQAAPWAKDEPEAAKLNPTPSHFEKGPDAAQRPVENISWHDAVAWCNALSRLTGRPPAYRRDGDTWARDPDSAGFRLPTEADWEHACRAGTTTRWSFGDDEARSGEFAWLDANANNTTHPVKAKQPNPWGLHDVHGNVYEWCEDGWSDTYDAKATVDPRVDRGVTRVIRGGGFGGTADWCRSAYRNHGRPGSRRRSRGLRVALSPPPSGPGL